MDVDKVVNEINQLRKLTRSGKSSLLKVVKQVNTQNLEKKEKSSFGKVNDFSGDNLKEIRNALVKKMTFNRTNN